MRNLNMRTDLSIPRLFIHGTRVKARLGFLSFLVSLAILAYGAGAATVHFQLFPYPALWQSYTEMKDFIQHWKNDLGIEPTRYLVAGRGSAGGEVVPQRNRAAPGLRVVAGYFHDPCHRDRGDPARRAGNRAPLLADRLPTDRSWWAWQSPGLGAAGSFSSPRTFSEVYVAGEVP
jgi:hypothetical protein